MKPIPLAAANAQRCVSASGWISLWIVSYRATQAETKIVNTTNRPAAFSAPERPDVEGEAERYRGEGVAVVVDQIGEECDGAGEDEHRCLQHGSRPEDGQADATARHAVPRSDDRAINKSVRMPVPMIVLVLAVSAGRIRSDLD